jgi:hypothetical protein
MLFVYRGGSKLFVIFVFLYFFCFETKQILASSATNPLNKLITSYQRSSVLTTELWYCFFVFRVALGLPLSLLGRPRKVPKKTKKTKKTKTKTEKLRI